MGGGGAGAGLAPEIMFEWTIIKVGTLEDGIHDCTLSRTSVTYAAYSKSIVFCRCVRRELMYVHTVGVYQLCKEGGITHTFLWLPSWLVG